MNIVKVAHIVTVKVACQTLIPSVIFLMSFFFTSCNDDGPSGPVPVIENFTPVSGEVGSSVTINGLNFSETSSEVEVLFNGGQAELTSATITQLVVKVPTGATTGKITVKVKGVSGASADEFQVVVNPWIQKKSIGYDVGRENAIGFSIGTKGYIGLGEDSFDPYYKDLWMYDPATDTWTQKADFGGVARGGAASFVIGMKAYVGTGLDEDGTGWNDFWEYDAAANTWVQKADFGGTVRGDAAAFAIGNKGYIGCGAEQYGQGKKDFWEYDPASNAWTQKADFGGTAREGSVGFAISSKGYIGTGHSTVPEKDFWEYDPATNAWTKKADFGGSTRFDAVAFVVDGIAYVGTGYLTSYASEGEKDFWKFNPSSNSWLRVTDFFGSKRPFGFDEGTRGKAVAFTIGSKGYVGTGDGYFFDNADLWEYTPE